MVRFLSIFALIFSLTASAGYAPGQVGTITVAGLTMSTTGLIILKCNISSNTFSVCINNSEGVAPAAYTPSGSLSFYPYACKFDQTNASAAALGLGLVYADVNVGNSVATALTNPVGVISGATGSSNVADVIFSAEYSASPQKETTVGGKVANGKFMFVSVTGSYGLVTCFGIEK